MSDANQHVITRRAGRVLLVDQAGRALLLRGGDPARPGLHWWFTPGGGLEPGESPVEAAARELFEEIGLRVEPAELAGPIRHERTEFSFDSRDYRQAQDFFLLRVAGWQVDMAGMDAQERLTITEHRWWSAAEIEASDELIYPADLAVLLGEQVDGVPETGL
ncbi:NUDIX domain-containing protein [Actinoplanes oblitus]|uniref:NUDIX domain-containing protein n=1 Tax=Actinoplanes oblitus TaxID=3040509 RepID=A0ABY8WI76_9ACTN|nr:NUDIX domain-containing protein [Actinoplanes oblitus]WIM95445.1 NUDIX domain-containing protein [Actinoplanes oblitus]